MSMPESNIRGLVARKTACMPSPKKLVFAPSRFGSDFVGGAETVQGEIARGLLARGWDIEIATTCARDHFTWANEYPPGVAEEDGLLVRRFPAVVSTPRAERAAFERTILNGGHLSVSEQQRWMNDDVRVPELFHYLLDHAADYDGLVFTPYMFWVAFACSQIAPSRTVLWTCLHEEPFARLEIFRPMLSGVAGLWFQTEPEHEFAHRLLPRPAPHRVVGCGVPVPESYDPEGFRKRFDISGPFVLYAGRREGAKNWEGLLRSFAAFARTHEDVDLSLVTIGSGEVKPPGDIAHRVIDLGFLSPDERDNAFAAADAYIQPSLYEAFSRTVMEAWLAGTMVIANGGCAPVRWHCERSGAGITYDDEFEFVEALEFVAEAPAAARAVAASGREYVLANYTWDHVLDAIEETLGEWLCGS
jgi:glycosyltransferase involved in cell wall biosynthesis